MRVGGAWIYEPSFNFYRALYRAEWIAPYPRVWAARPADYDYFVYHPADLGTGEIPRMRVLYADPVSGTRLGKVEATPGSARRGVLSGSPPLADPGIISSDR